MARDIERSDWRTFRLDRIRAPRLTGIRFVPRDPPDAAAFVAHAISTAPYRYRARLVLHAPVEVIAAQLPPTVGVVEPAEDGGCVLTTGSERLDALVFHLGRLDCDFVVLEPPELIDRVQVLGTRMQRAVPHAG